MDEATLGKGEENLMRLSTRSPQESSASNRLKPMTRKTSQLLEMLLREGSQKIVYTFNASQADLAQKLSITRQALSVHLRRLRRLGLIQVGRGFLNVTEAGLKATGHNTNPIVLMVRLHPKNRLEAFGKVRELPVTSILRVTGEWDLVIMSGQESLDQILEALSKIEGVQETRALVTIEVMK